MDVSKTQAFVEENFTNSALPCLQEYIKIPNTSRAYDPEWQTNGYTEQACDLLVNWVKAQNLKGLKLEVQHDEGKTPLIFMEIDGTENNDKTVMFYGHFDKQPPFDGWYEGYGATIPVLTEDGTKLYGRGSSDDGYAIFASILSIKACQEQGIPHARCVVIIESDEESENEDLPYYIEKLKERIGNPTLIFCLDSGCANYDQMWLTTSLRGYLEGDLRVDILNDGCHSGNASGIVPSSTRILRRLLDRLEDPKTGKVHDSLHVEIPENRRKEAEELVSVIGDFSKDFPFVEGATHVQAENLAELYLNRTWRPTLCITGCSGIPGLTGGNVLRPYTTLKLAIRIPPGLTAESACENLKKILTEEPADCNAKVTLSNVQAGAGWNAPELPDWLQTAADSASKEFFGKGVAGMGEGGSIPFIGFLGEMFPEAKFVITGVLGPNANAHGPNEFLHIPMTKKLIGCVSHILAAHHSHQML